MEEKMSWSEAILKVLTDAERPLHYSEITQRILDNNLHDQNGATPAQTVSSTITTKLQNEVVRVDRGVYALKSGYVDIPANSDDTRKAAVMTTAEPYEAEEDSGFINAFGMFWRRDEVDWHKKGKKLLGQQLKASKIVNFAEQIGVYILYNGDRVIYVGRITEPRLGHRLWEHTRDRLAGRWDLFSWFGVLAVADDGTLGPTPDSSGQGFSTDMLVATMESLLIEGLEPPQNRRRGDGFNATEFIQTTDPAVTKRRAEAYIQRLMSMH